MALEAGFQPMPGYTLVQPLGAGAFGDVWEARQDGARQRVAMKFLDCRARPATDVANEVRILRALTAFKHPRIIPLLGIHASTKYLLLIMERADCSLADLHQVYREETGGNIPPEHALDLLEQAADALDFLATLKLPGVSGGRGLQHCDVKPSNLLMVGGQLKVTDFGLCSGSGWCNHTGWKGTIPYAGPEMFNGAPAPGTDQFALAVTFCELVMGERPFWKREVGDSPPNGLPIDLTKLREKEFPVISRALHPFPSARWPSCRALIHALRKATVLPRRGESVRIFPRGLKGPLRGKTPSKKVPVVR